MSDWIEANELEAYGLCGLTPEMFEALTIPEYASMVEAAYWREARWRQLIAETVTRLMAAWSEIRDPAGFAEQMTGGNQVAKIERARRQRLDRLHAQDETWPQ